MLSLLLLATAAAATPLVVRNYGYDDCSTSEGSWQGQNYDCGAGDDSKFRQCANGQWVVMPCAAGTHCEVEPWLKSHWSPCVTGGSGGYGGYGEEGGYGGDEGGYGDEEEGDYGGYEEEEEGYGGYEEPEHPSYTPPAPKYTPPAQYTPSKPPTYSTPTPTPKYGQVSEKNWGGGGDCSKGEGSWKGQNYDCMGDSSKFLQCDHGKWVLMPCAKGTHCERDPWLKYHQSPCVGDGGSHGHGHGGSAGSYGYKAFEVEEKKYDDYGYHEDCSNSHGSWKGQNYDCGAGDKSHFRQCDHGKWVTMPCGAGTHCDVNPWLQKHWSPCVGGGDYGGYEKPKPKPEPKYAPKPKPSPKYEPKYTPSPKYTPPAYTPPPKY